MTTPQKPVAVDDWSNRTGGFRQEWYCTPPPRGISYQVLREEWLDAEGQPGTKATAPIRRIYEWKPVGPWRRRVLRQRLHRLRHPALWVIVLGLVLACTAGSCKGTGGGGQNPNPAPVPSSTCTSPSPNPNPQPQPGCS